jgi:carbamoyl-phosphate synthase / aspartate carbamoyltransferase / dihydroorotase
MWLRGCRITLAEIFNIPEQPETYIEIDLEARWNIRAGEMRTRCGWTPFEEWPVRGRVINVYLRGQQVLKDRELISSVGIGKNIRISKNKKLKGVKNHGNLCTPNRSENPHLPFGDQRGAPFYGKDILSVNQFSRNDLEYIFAVAHEMREMVARVGSFDLLKGKILANLFYEPSTRTSSSFTSAMERLGGSVVPINEVRYSQCQKASRCQILFARLTVILTSSCCATLKLVRQR